MLAIANALGGMDRKEAAEAAGMDRQTLRDWVIRYNEVSNDPQFEEKVTDVVGLYLNPPDRALVLCVDEKSQIQALDRTNRACP
jgi:transposase-like protein